MLAAKLGVTTSPTGFTGFKLRDGTTVESHRPRDGPSLLVSPSQPKQPPTCPFAGTWSAGRRQRYSHSVAPARDPRRQLSRLRIVDEDRLVAALARNLGHGVSASQRTHDRRAPVRSGSIHPGNADGTSGDDGPGDPVAYARLLAYRLRSPARANPKWPPAYSIIGGSSPSEKSYPENTATHGLKRYIPGQGRCFFGMAKRPNALVGFDATMNPRGGAATCGLTNARTCAIPPGGGRRNEGVPLRSRLPIVGISGLQTGDFTRLALGCGLLK
jgi:hypothetical protein